MNFNHQQKVINFAEKVILNLNDGYSILFVTIKEPSITLESSLRQSPLLGHTHYILRLTSPPMRWKHVRQEKKTEN